MSRSGRAFHFEVLAIIVMELLQRLDDEEVQGEPDGPAPVGIAAELPAIVPAIPARGSRPQTAGSSRPWSGCASAHAHCWAGTERHRRTDLHRPTGPHHR